MKPLPHQQRFIDQNPKKAILAWEMRVGKSLPACHWIDNPCRAGNTYIITMKQNLKEWVDFGTRATVLTKEQFKKLAPKDGWTGRIIRNPTAIVVDEAHFFASGLFVKGRSQLATALYKLVKENPQMDVLLLTATPVRQSAWSLHTLLCYIDVYYDWKAWRARFFKLQKLPFLRFPAWMPRSDWRDNIKPILEKHCDIVSLKDIVDYLPPAETKIIKIKQPKYKKPTNEIVTWTHEHKHEQQGKVNEILKLGYRKLIVVAHYTEQIDSLASDLSKDKPVFILDGRTKDPEAIKKQAQESEDCYLIVQASMGMGWDGWMFGAIVFASMSHSCVNHKQMTGRLRHLKHLQPVTYLYLCGGRWDTRIMETIKKGQDFDPHIYHDIA